MVAVMLGFLAAQQVTAARAEEAAGRLDHFLARPVSRISWLAGRTAVAVAALAGEACSPGCPPGRGPPAGTRA